MVSPLLDLWFANIFSHLVYCLFTLLSVHLEHKSFSIWWSQIYLFYFVTGTFCVQLPTPRSQRYTLFPLRVSQLKLLWLAPWTVSCGFLYMVWGRGSNFGLCTWISSCPSLFVKRLFFHHWIIFTFGSLVKDQVILNVKVYMHSWRDRWNLHIKKIIHVYIIYN